MLPSIGSSFLPMEGYIAFILISLFVIVLYFTRIVSDLSYVQKYNIQLNTTPLYISFALSILSLAFLFLPFVEIPIIGGISILEMASRMDDDMVYITPLIFLNIFLVVFRGIIAFKKLAFKGAKSENFDILFASLVLIIDILVYIELNNRIHPSYDSENLFAQTISEAFRIGLGMYLTLFFSIVQLIFAIFSNKISATALVNPSQNNVSLNINELRELKALLDEGVITQEEFENRKQKIL